MLAPALDVLREFSVALLDLLLGIPRLLVGMARRAQRLKLFHELSRDELPAEEAEEAEPAPTATLRRVVLCCGDASGETHALRLLEELRRRHPDLQVEGFGGARLEAAGMQVWEPLADLNVMGFKDVAAQLPLFFRCVYRFAQRLHQAPPDAVILVDYPGLNRHLLRIAARRKVPVIDYIAPQLWAWSAWRVRDFRHADALLTILPFERDWYARHGAEARYVGHPLADSLAARTEAEAEPPPALQEEGPWVGLLPGSRRREIRDNLPAMLAAAAELRQRIPEVRFVLPHLREEVRPLLEEILAEAPVSVLHAQGCFHTVLPRLDAALAVSGTASLEVAAHGVPSVVAYAVPSRLSRWLMHAAVAVPWVAAANLVAGRELVVERLGDDLDPQTLAGDLERLLLPAHHDAAVQELTQLRDRHLRPGTALRAALAIEDAVNLARTHSLS